jgi:hypothetical protein
LVRRWTKLWILVLVFFRLHIVPHVSLEFKFNGQGSQKSWMFS